MTFQYNADLQPFNTFHVQARASVMATFNSVEELRILLDHVEVKGRPILILGGGSNLLFTQDWPGVVLRNDIQRITHSEEGSEEILVTAGAGMVWHDLVMYTVEHGWGGLENLSLIPGKVGAAPMQNIGAYGVEIKDTFDHLEALRISDGAVVRFDREECRFGYRESFFKREGKGAYVILNVAFRLKKHAPVHTQYGNIRAELEKRGITHPTIRDVSDAVVHIRRSKLPDPNVLGNAGSFFKNPVVPMEVVERIQQTHPSVVFFPAGDRQAKLAAGWLIEQAGWKGFREGDRGVHKDQALVLVNYGAATGKEVFDLSTQVLASVERTFEVELEREVNII